MGTARRAAAATAATATTTTDETPHDRVLLALVAIAGVLPLFAARHLPFTDLPEHTAVVSAIARWDVDRVGENYVFAFPRTPYVLFHVLAAGVASIVGDAETAVRLLLVVIGLGFPLALRSLLAAGGGDRRLALFAPLVFFGRPLTMGFLPFVASVPVLVFSVATVLRNAHAPTLPRRILLGTLAVVLFYLHVSSFLVFVATALTTTAFVRGPRRALPDLACLAPAAACAALWASSGRLSLHGEHFVTVSEVDYASPPRALYAFPFWLHDVWRSHVDEGCAVAWWLAILALVVASLRAGATSPRSTIERLLPLLCALVAYFGTPFHVGAGFFLNVRLAPLLALFAVTIPRAPSASRLGAAARLVVVGATGVMSSSAAIEIARAEAEELAGFDGLVARIPAGARVVALNFERKSAHARVAPWLHVVSYHRVGRPGVTGYSFAALEHWPLQYAPGKAPPAKVTALDGPTNPCVFRNAQDGEFYDYALVRGSVDPFVDEPPGPRYRLVAQTATSTPFRLYEKTTGERWSLWPAGVDEGPCVRRLGAE